MFRGLVFVSDGAETFRQFVRGALTWLVRPHVAVVVSF